LEDIYLLLFISPYIFTQETVADFPVVTLNAKLNVLELFKQFPSEPLSNKLAHQQVGPSPFLHLTA
jgi:hypothetical protein